MAIQSFSSGQTLTAQQMNDLQKNDYNQTVSAKTTSYVLAAGDVGTHVQMTASTATTITFGTATFVAGDSVFVSSQGTGVCTLTAGTGLTLTSTGSLALSQYSGGVVRFQSSTAATFFASDITASSSGFVVIKAQTAFTSVASVNVDNVFSATYTNYKLIVSVSSKTVDSDLTMRLRVGGVDASGATDYRYAFLTRSSDGTSGADNSNGASFMRIGYAPATSLIPNGVQNIDIFKPYVAAITTFTGTGPRGLSSTALAHETFGGAHILSTSYDGFTLLAASGNMTGTYAVYGYGITV